RSRCTGYRRSNALGSVREPCRWDLPIWSTKLGGYMKRFLTIIATLLAATAALAQGGPPPMHAAETVTVSGTGKAMLTPDRFTFSVGVQTVATTVEDAVAENNKRVQNVINAL